MIILRSFEPESVTVHDHMPIKCKTCITWGPLWIPSADDNAEPFRATKWPDDHGPYLITVDDYDVISCATLRGCRLDDDSIARLKALGHNMFDVMG